MTIEALEARRRSLALDAAEGVPGAARALQEVEREIAQLQLATQRAQLAEKERAARAEAEAQAKAAAEREAAKRKLQALLEARSTAALEIEAATDELVRRVEAMLRLGRDAYILSSTLGTPKQKYLLDGAIGNYLLYRLGSVAPFPERPEKRPLATFFRRPTEGGFHRGLLDIICGGAPARGET